MGRIGRDADAYARYKAATELPLLLGPMLVDTTPATERVLTGVDWLIWGVFAADYLIGLSLAPGRRAYVRREWPNLLLVVLPFLRPLRVLRSARALRLLRLTRVAAALSESAHEVRRLLVRHHLHYVLTATLTLLVGGALAMDAAESGGHGPIQGLPDALWWAASTMTTVGYGDAYPVTPVGRGVALVLMVGGIAFFGVLTANLAAFFLERGPADGATRPDDAALHARLAAIEAHLARLSRTDG